MSIELNIAYEMCCTYFKMANQTVDSAFARVYFQYDNKTPLRSFALTILFFFFQKMKLKATFLESFCAATSSAHLVCTPFSMRASLSAPSVR